MDNYHITKDGDQWKLKKEGAERASKIADTKREIIDQTRNFMSDRIGSVKIHKENGRFQEERTIREKMILERVKANFSY